GARGFLRRAHFVRSMTFGCSAFFRFRRFFVRGGNLVVKEAFHPRIDAHGYISYPSFEVRSGYQDFFGLRLGPYTLEGSSAKGGILLRSRNFVTLRHAPSHSFRFRITSLRLPRHLLRSDSGHPFRFPTFHLRLQSTTTLNPL